MYRMYGCMAARGPHGQLNREPATIPSHRMATRRSDSPARRTLRLSPTASERYGGTPAPWRSSGSPRSVLFDDGSMEPAASVLFAAADRRRRSSSPLRPAWSVSGASPRRLISPTSGTTSIAPRRSRRDGYRRQRADYRSPDRYYAGPPAAGRVVGARPAPPAATFRRSSSYSPRPRSPSYYRTDVHTAAGGSPRGTHDYAAPTYSSARKAASTLPANISVQGLTGIAAAAVGEYVCTVACGKMASPSDGPSVVYSKADGTGFELVYERGTWAVISSPHAHGSLAFADVEREFNPCLVPTSQWKVSDGSEDWQTPGPLFCIEEKGAVGIVEPTSSAFDRHPHRLSSRDGVPVGARSIRSLDQISGQYHTWGSHLIPSHPSLWTRSPVRRFVR
jgi:hypothetical protein